MNKGKDELFSSFLVDVEEMQVSANELEKEFQLASNVNMEKIKTTLLRLQAFLKLYCKS